MWHTVHGTAPGTQRTQACHQNADGFFCKTTPAVEAQPGTIASITSTFACAVRDVAVAFGVTLQPSLSDPAKVHENKKLGAGSSAEASSTALLPLPECSSTEAPTQAYLPVLATIALPAVDRTPLPHRYRPWTLPPAQGKIEAKASDPAELEKPIQAALVGNFQAGTTTIEKSGPRTSLLPPPSQMSTANEDVERIRKYAKRREVPYDRTAEVDGTALETANTREADSLTWRPALRPQVCEHMENEASLSKTARRRAPAPRGEHTHANTATNASAPLTWLPLPPPAPWSWTSEPSPHPDCSSRTSTGAFARRRATVRPVKPPCSSPTRTRSVPAPPRAVTSTSSSMCQPQCSRWQGLPVPPPAPATTALVPATHTTTQKRKDRAESASVARTNTQKRRDRAKIVRIRELDRQRDAGHDVPSTGAARLRRKQRANADARRVAEWMQEARL